MNFKNPNYFKSIFFSDLVQNKRATICFWNINHILVLRFMLSLVILAKCRVLKVN